MYMFIYIYISIKKQMQFVCKSIKNYKNYAYLSIHCNTVNTNDDVYIVNRYEEH